MRQPSVRLTALALLALLVLAGIAPEDAMAHEIPRRVTVQVFAKPEGHTFRLLVRVPLEAMRDVEWVTRGPGYLDVGASRALLADAARIWVAGGVTVFADGAPLGAANIAAVRVSLPSDAAFARYDLATRHFAEGELGADIDIPWQQAMLDVQLEYPITSDRADFSIDPAYATLGIKTNSVIRFLPPTGGERLYAYVGDPGVLALDPSAFGAAWRFARLGVSHILEGIDHLLFLLCLLIPFRRPRELIALVTAFTLAHSITLFASAFGLAPDALWFPPFVELSIAASIVYMACENMLGATMQRRWLMTFAFGLVHGFGFSFALRENLQFAGSHLLSSLAAFNIGVELGQLAVLAVALPVLIWLFRRVPERAGVILLSAFIAHTSWHWTTERWDVLAQYRLAWPAFDASMAVLTMRWLLIAIITGSIGYLLRGALGRFVRSTARSASRPASPVTSLFLLVATFGGALVLGDALTPSVAAAQAPSPSMPASARKTTMAGIYTAEQARQGREVFVGTCTGCHTPAAHTGVVFTSKWVGRSVDDLFTYIRNSMPKIAPGSLSDDEYVWVTAYILKLNGMPAGSHELSGEPAELRAVRIDTVRSGVRKSQQ